MNNNTAVAGLAGTGVAHRGMRRLAAIVATAALAFFLAGVATPPQAAQAAPYGQCDSLYNTPGLGMDCTVDVVNYLDLATGVDSSTTTYTQCFGFANTALTCSGTTVSSDELVTSVSQCNSSLNGGGGSMHCSVTITNNIVGAATAVGATVNQCNNSLGGGGIVLRACNPDPASTSGADISQCNNSDNGGGSSLTCIVTAGSTTSAALRVTVSQCNFSADGGGSLIVCSVGMTNNITPAVVVVPPEEEEEVTPPTEEETVTPPVTPATGPNTTTTPRRSSQVLGSQVVAGGAQVSALANTGLVTVSPLVGLALTSVGIALLICVQIIRRRSELTA